MKNRSDRPAVTEFERYQAKHGVVARIKQMLPLLSEAQIARVGVVLEAFIVATEEEADRLKDVCEVKPPNLDAVFQLAETIVAAHADEDDDPGPRERA